MHEGQVLLELETSKVVLEVTAVANGVISDLKVSIGDHVSSEQTLMALSGEEVTLFEQSEIIEFDAGSCDIDHDACETSDKGGYSSFTLWMVGLVLVIFIVSLSLRS